MKVFYYGVVILVLIRNIRYAFDVKKTNKKGFFGIWMMLIIFMFLFFFQLSQK